MAVVVVEDNATRSEDFEGTPSFTAIPSGGGGAQELVTFYQGSAAGSIKNTATTKDTGFWVNAGATYDATAGSKETWMSKIFVSDGQDLNSAALQLWVGDTTSDYREAYLHDDGTAYGVYPPTNSWIIRPWNPTLDAWLDAPETGTPDFTIVDQYGIVAQFVNGAAKSENMFMDSIDWSDGLWLTRGDSTNPDATFEDFWTDDEGTSTGRFGHVTKPGSLDGVYQCYGGFVIGRTQGGSTANATEFTDSNKTLVFPGGRVDTGWNFLELDTTNASTVISIAACTFTGSGRSALKQRFRTAAGTVDSSPGIDTTADEIEFDTGATDLTPHGFQTGDALLYSKEGGTATTGLTDATVYYASIVGGDGSSVGLSTTRANAFAGTLIALTATAGEEHSLTREPITRPNMIHTGTTADAATIDASTYIGWDTFTLRAGHKYLDCAFVGCRLIDLDTNTGGTLDGGVFSEMICDVGDAHVVVDDLADVLNCTFTHYVQGGDSDGTFNQSGHAIEITDNTGSPFTFTNNSFAGYGPDQAEFSTAQAFTSEIVTTDAVHGFTTGDAVYYHKDGGTAAIGLTAAALYYVRVVSTTTLTLHPSWADATENANTENLTTNGAETHLLYSARAAIVNNSGGAITINWSGVDASAPSIRNIGVSTTTVTNSVNFTVDGLVAGTEVRIFRTSDGVELAGVESSGTSFVYGHDGGDAGTAVYVIIQKVDYIWIRYNETLAASDKSIQANQRPDPDYAP